MATKVFETETLELQDGTEVTIRPLTIKKLRKFMDVVKQLDGMDEEGDEAVDLMVKACSIALEKSAPDLANDSERLEDALDVPTMWRILEIAGGVKLGDPNQLATGLAGRS